MTVTNKYSLYGINLNDAADVFIGGLTTLGLEPNSQVDQEITNDVYAKWYGLSGQAPVGSFATFHVATALANIGLEGLAIGGLATGLEMWLQKHLSESTREGATKHRQFTMTAGLVVPRTLTVGHGPGQHASVAYEIISTWDGTNDPFTITDLQSLPTAEPDDERFALASDGTIGAKSLTHFRQLEIDFGINVVTEGADGDLWPTFCSIESITPTITLRGIDPEWLKAANVPLAGLACTHANTAIYLRKRAIGGTFVIDGTAEHIKMTAAGLAHVVTAADASVQAASETSLVIPLYGDGSNAPLTIDTASAIT